MNRKIPFQAMVSVAILLSILKVNAIAAGDSSPDGTLAAFTKALDEGDTATLSNLVVGEANQKTWVFAYAAQLRAFGNLEQAVTKRFGKAYADDDSGKLINDEIDTSRDGEFNYELKHARLGKIDGDTVVVSIDQAASDDREGRLVKVDGQWKVDLASFFNYYSVADTARLAPMATAAAGLAKDVEGGKYAALEDAAEAVKDRLESAEPASVKIDMIHNGAQSRHP